ncbi:hypothetical protein B0I37DRAFT_371411 [Chaetomium sp. MPI-CAGE-AT-0009]|nr:hypothetical protein B0I37DRAFT_371411 [Chaetomium sp. MPI-CAGE-AT-0009]
MRLAPSCFLVVPLAFLHSRTVHKTRRSLWILIIRNRTKLPDKTYSVERGKKAFIFIVSKNVHRKKRKHEQLQPAFHSVYCTEEGDHVGQ